MKKIIGLFLILSCTLHVVNAQQMNSKNPDYFPIGVWLQNPDDADSYKNIGINMYVGIYRGLDQKQLDQLKKADMKIICDLNDFARTKLNEKSIYAWMHGDEPDNAQWNEKTKRYDPCLDPAIIFRDYQKIKKTDPSRPVYLNVGRGVAFHKWIGRGDCTGNTNMYKVNNNGYLKGCDIASYDIYPVNSTEPEVKDSLWYVAKGIDYLREWSNDFKPVWCWIETTRIGEDSERKPTVKEVKTQVWMALIHGAKGFGYFCHSFVQPSDTRALLTDKEMAQGVKQINKEVASLAKVLNAQIQKGLPV